MVSGITEKVAQFCVEARFEHFPETVQKEATRGYVNFIGCALGGASHKAVSTAAGLADAFSGPRGSYVIGRPERLDPLNAALINCMSSAVHTYDDTHLKSIIHPGGPVLASILALSDERAVTGTEALLAQVLGVEISCRLGNALMLPPARANLSLFMTGVTTGVGAAAAASRILRLDAEKTVAAIGIAATQAAGLREMHGTMCSSFVPANAARAGIYAALLAERGFESAKQSLEGAKGLGNVFAEDANYGAITDGLGEEYETLFNAHKPYPCGVAIHPAIDACLEAVVEKNVSAEEIATCKLTVHPVALALTGRTHPASGLEAQVSIYHWTAATLVKKAAGLKEGSDSAVQDPAVIAMRERIAVAEDSNMRPEEARLVLELKDGRQVEAHVPSCRGTRERPMTDDELSAKFLGQAEMIFSTAQAQALLERCWEISSTPDVSAISQDASLATN